MGLAHGQRSGWLLGLLTIVMLLASGAAESVRGQSALDGFDPNADNTIRIVVVQPDGKILIGGDISGLLTPDGFVLRNRIARLNPDGSLDLAFNPNANGPVNAIALQADGKILVGGEFSGANSIGGQTRNRIARLDPVTGLADSFNPNANNSVVAIAVQADGKILVTGNFNGANSIGGQARNRIARLDATTGLADSFDPNANNSVSAIAIQADGKILAGGAFTSIGGQTRNRIARLDATTGMADAFDPNANNSVNAIAVQADGKILVGGNFNAANSIGGQTRNRVARLDALTGLADSFNPNANNSINAIAVQADGKIVVGGSFFGANSIGGQTRNRLARLDPTTGLADLFDPNANNSVNTIVVETTGKLLVGGVFTNVRGVTRNRIARLETTGRLDQTLNLSIVSNNSIAATAVQPDGKILIGGSFNSVLGVPRRNIARLNQDGTLDMAFDPFADGVYVNAITVQPDGKILTGGDFTFIGGQNRNRIARLDAVTGLADSFDPNMDQSVFSIALQPDGKILVGGAFTTVAPSFGPPVTRNSIARLNADGTLDTAFDPNPASLNGSNIVFSIVVQRDGKILVGGDFTSIGGQTRSFLARLDAATGLADSFNANVNRAVNAVAMQTDGKILVAGDFNSIGGQTRNYFARVDGNTGLADAFNPNPDNGVSSMALQTDGKVLAGGLFTNIGGQLRNRIARLDAATGLADSFDPNADNDVRALAVLADGKILAGGFFRRIGGQFRNLFGRLSNSTVASQNLAVTQTSVTWTRGGASSQLSRVAFEHSADNVTYTLLGNGTPTGNTWTLTGLNLSTGQNFYIRARGYHHGGFANGSESITESVRTVFIPGPITHSISGHLTYANGTIGGKNVTMTLTGPAGFTAVQMTDNNGDYLFSNVPAGGDYTLTASKTGDVNGITAFDASLAARFAANPLGWPLTTNEQIAADASNNGSVTAFDASEIARTAANIANPGIAGTWKISPAGFSFPNLSANQTNQNATVILVGDVTGNWTPAGLSILRAPSTVLATIQVSLPIKQDPHGGSSTIPITVGDTTGQGVFAYAFDITFNEAVLQPQIPTPFDTTGTLSSGWTLSENLVTPGHLIINAFNTSAMSGQGVLLYLKFDVVGSGGSTTPLTWQTFEFNEGDPADTNINGAFTATSPTATSGMVSGRIASDTGLPVAGAVVRLSGTQNRKTITDANGTYRFDEVETRGFYTVTPTLANFSFSPAARSISQLGERTEALFTGTRDAVATGNAIDTPEYFVRQQYLDFLGREPDQAGWLYWTDQISGCGMDQNCIRQRRLDVSAAFFMSDEFQLSGNYVYRLYRAALGRQMTYAEFNDDHKKVIGGADLESLRTQFADEFVQRAAFLEKYQNATWAEGFVDSLLQTVRQDAQLDLSGRREALIAIYNSGSDTTHSRSAVLRAIAESSEFKSAVYNSSFVLMEYFGYLRRDLDQSGFDFWLNVLNNRDLGNYRGMVCSFLTSAEYQQRFSPIVTHSNAECSLR